jgi:hypothetical protein
MRQLANRFVVVALVLVLFSSAMAGTSIKLGATFPGWDRVRSGTTFDAATDLTRGYARQIGHICTMPEVFVRERSTSIITALVFYQTYLPYGASERVLLDGIDQRVALISSRTMFSDVLSVMVSTRSGVVLVLC